MSESKTCLIHGPRNNYDECKVLGDFGAKYAKGKPTKDRGNHPVLRKCFNKNLETNAIFSNVVDNIFY